MDPCFAVVPKWDAHSHAAMSHVTSRDYPGYTHGYPEVDPYPYPLKTRTRTHGYGLLDGYHSHGCGLRPVAGIPVDDGRKGTTQAVAEGARVASGSVGWLPRARAQLPKVWVVRGC